MYWKRLLSSIKITSLPTLLSAISSLHKTYRIPHIIVTSVRFDSDSNNSDDAAHHHPPPPPPPPTTFSLVGSTADSNLRPRPFKIDFPAIDCDFVGTGDMFSALMLVRLREAVFAPSSSSSSSAEGTEAVKQGTAATEEGTKGTETAAATKAEQEGSSDGHSPEHSKTDISKTKGWISPDSLPSPTSLPLAQAAEKALGSIQSILLKTKIAHDEALKELGSALMDQESSSEKRMHLRKTKAAEVRVVRNVGEVKTPGVKYRAVALEI